MQCQLLWDSQTESRFGLSSSTTLVQINVNSKQIEWTGMNQNQPKHIIPLSKVIGISHVDEAIPYSILYPLLKRRNDQVLKASVEFTKKSDDPTPFVLLSTLETRKKNPIVRQYMFEIQDNASEFVMQVKSLLFEFRKNTGEIELKWKGF